MKPKLSPLALATRDAIMALGAAGATRVVLFVGNAEKVTIGAAGVEGGPDGLARFVTEHLPKSKHLLVRGKMDPAGGN